MIFAVIIVFVVLFAVLYLWWSSSLSEWKKLKIPHVAPHAVWGNFRDVICMKKTSYEVYDEIYREFPELPYVGVYIVNRPGLLLRDPELIKDICQSNFSSFLDNDLLIDEKIDPIFAGNPFTTRGDKWKNRRIVHTRQFSSGKVKFMFEQVKQGGDRMIRFLEEETTKNGKFTIQASELAAKYTVYNAGNCALGIDPRTFDEVNAEMREMGRQIIEPNLYRSMKQFLIFIVPTLANLLSVSIVPPGVTDKFRRLVKEQLQYRKEHGIVRNDFFEAIQEHKGDKASEEDIMVQVGGFFLDGFATNSSALNFALFELSRDLDVQRKLAEEIDEFLKKHNGQISYEDFERMPYLDAIFAESLRMYPSLPTLTRVCTKTFTFPPVNSTSKPLVVQPETPIVLPLTALHYDEKYFQDPYRFDPSRFLGENKDKINKDVYMPFGEGPRACLGKRFALMQSKMMIFKLISRFEIRLNSKTIVPLKYVQSILLAVEGGVWIDIYKRQT